MDPLSCDDVRLNLSAYRDRELQLETEIGITSHLRWCSECEAEAQRLDVIGEALRQIAVVRNRMPPDLSSLQSIVLARLKAEREHSLGAQARGLFEDMHLVWAGLGATFAMFVSVLAMFSLLQFALNSRADSLSGILRAMGSPGSNQNPVPLDERIRLPRVVDGVPAAILAAPSREHDDVLFALAGVVTREGRFMGLELLLADQHDSLVVADVLTSAALTRFEPAIRGGSPIAVNVVWLLARTTVRGKLHS